MNEYPPELRGIVERYNLKANALPAYVSAVAENLPSAFAGYTIMTPEQIKQFWEHVENGDIEQAANLAHYRVIFKYVIENHEKLGSVLEPLFVKTFHEGTFIATNAEIRKVIERCDRTRLLEAGPLPDGDSFTVYRGTKYVPWPWDLFSGMETMGPTWTPDCDYACSIAACLIKQGSTNEAVLTATVNRDEVYFCAEQERGQVMYCEPTEWTDMFLTRKEIQAGAERYKQRGKSTIS